MQLPHFCDIVFISKTIEVRNLKQKPIVLYIISCNLHAQIGRPVVAGMRFVQLEGKITTVFVVMILENDV